MSLASVVSRADPQEVQLLDEDTLDPNLTYRWVHNVPQPIAKRLGQGYRFVSREDDGVETLVADQKTPDDHIYNGDTVLMCCEKVIVNTRRDRTSKLATSRLGTPVTQFQREHQGSGVLNSKVLLDEEGE